MIERREQVWITTSSGMVCPGIVLWRRLGFVKVLYWDNDVYYRKTLFLPSNDYLFPRVSEPWSSSCGGMERTPPGPLVW